jgi:hypothetical protein
LQEVASFAAAFGKRKVVSNWPSFEDTARGRATMSTELGPRRVLGAMPPPPRKALTCDTVKQDCNRPELGCYMAPPAVCALSGGAQLDAACDATFACAPGLDCVSGQSNPKAYVCKPYCDPNDSTSASACATLCATNYLTFKDTSGAVVAGLCLPN